MRAGGESFKTSGGGHAPAAVLQGRRPGAMTPAPTLARTLLAGPRLRLARAAAAEAAAAQLASALLVCQLLFIKYLTSRGHRVAVVSLAAAQAVAYAGVTRANRIADDGQPGAPARAPSSRVGA